MSDGTGVLQSDDDAESSLCESSEKSWRGCSMEEVYRNLNAFELEHFEPVKPSADHTVLHHFPIRENDNTPPRPLKCHPKWDAQHVRLPCSTKSQYPVTHEDGSATIEGRWAMIEKALLGRNITSSHELEAVILEYNTKYADVWKFKALHRLFEDELDESETKVFFEDLLPRIIKLALQMPQLIQAPIPLLKQGESKSLTITQQQIACLLANAFLCTYPRRNTLKRNSEYSTFPDINFNRLFQSSGHAVLEKIKCICHYFRRVCPTERDEANVPTGVVTFSRRHRHACDMPSWLHCEAPLGSTLLHINSNGTIEDQGLGLLQVDFANKFLGGGVLGGGCVQEEIRFVICPELIVSKLFTECLKPAEALIMSGCERYSNYTGYANTFHWAGNHEDVTPRDSSRRRQTHIVAIDALHFVQTAHQFHEQLMLRELNKAYVGFLHTLDTPAPGVASGNWGCGAFGGEARLKALLQLMVCCVTKRPLAYFTFGDDVLRNEIYDMYIFLCDNNIKVKQLWETLKKFQSQRLPQKELYNFIYSSCGKDQSDQQIKERSPKTSPAKTSKMTTTLPERKNELTPVAALPSESQVESKLKSATLESTNPIHDTKRQRSRAVNISQDLFASDSSLDDDNDNDSKSAANDFTSASPISSEELGQQSQHTVISIASSQDADCTSSSVEYVQTIAAESSQKNGVEATASPSTKRKEARQRTLLEMLDQSYKSSTCGTSTPASKRACLGKRQL